MVFAVLTILRPLLHWLPQEGICMTLNPEFHFLEVAYPYVARRLLTDEDPALRERLIQVEEGGLCGGGSHVTHPSMEMMCTTCK
jgi:hypothetical protein